MAKVYFLLFVWGPALLGFSLGWWIRHPNDWSGPAVVGPVGLVLTTFTYRWGVKRLPRVPEEQRPFFLAGMIAGALVGVVVCGMLLLGIIG